jgi:alpha-aminoadipic semialdehyde synthase
MNSISIRHEDKYKLERRTPLTPNHVRLLISESNLNICVEKSEKRIFKDKEYADVGAKLIDDANECDIILGVKEMPIDYFQKNKTYIFFSHVIKGQEYNMPMFKSMIKKECNLIDYECITDETNRRLVFFGRYAGIAGMINSLWSYGQRLKIQGFETPFLKIQQSRRYDSIDEAKEVILKVGQEIYENGLPKSLTPVVIGVTGYGNVSRGAQEIIDLLPIQEIAPTELADLDKSHRASNNIIYKTIFKEENLSQPKNPNQEFELQHYYENPEMYENQFDQFVPHLSILMNCMYWDEKYPRIITKDFLQTLFTENPNQKLKVIGDITCDPNGSIECLHSGTTIQDPVFVYNPYTQNYKMGFEGEGILIMGVDILPSELPRDSSKAFGDAMIDYIPQLAKVDFNQKFEDLELIDELKKALILHKGKFTPDYEYLKEFV